MKEEKECQHLAKDDAKREKRIGPLVKKWSKLLGLTPSWQIEYGFVDEFDEESIPSLDGQKGAEAGTLYPYRQGYILLKREAVDHGTKEEAERMVLHELIHILHAPLLKAIRESVPVNNKGMIDGPVEEATDWMTNIILSLRDRGRG